MTLRRSLNTADESIWARRHKIEKARRDKMTEAMQAYDDTVYRPAITALVEECARVGHTKGNFHNNGLGWCWWYCNKCGGRFEIEDEHGNRKE